MNKKQKNEDVFTKIAHKTATVAQKVGNTLQSSLATYMNKHKSSAEKKSAAQENTKKKS